MKVETIIKGQELYKQIESAMTAKDVCGLINTIELRHSNRGRLATIRTEGEHNKTYFENINDLPDGLTEQITEEGIRFMQRCKRHCTEWEQKLKEELEDLV